MKKGLFIVCFFNAFISFAQKDNIKSFIPKDYDTLYGGFVKGDLNRDGIEDVVLAIFNKKENEDIENNDPDSVPPRLLIILFGNQQGDYTESVTSSGALLCKSCGGVFGDPFSSIEIKNNVLIISHYGGSSDRWSITDKFRYQNNNWYLIGETKYSYSDLTNCEKLKEFASSDYNDENFVTGEFEIKKVSEDCKLLENKKGKKAVQPLITLSNFNIDN